jgi:hypothetical protein
MNDDFIDFVNGSEKVPSGVNERTLKYVLLTLNPKRMLLKFYSANLFGALITLVICPQFGFGPLGGEEGILGYIMDFGPIMCGIFCALIFFVAGSLSSLFFLKQYEKQWISDHKFSVVTPWVSMIFFMAIILKYYAPNPLHHNTVSFHFSWYLTALLASYIILNRRKKYTKFTN